MTNNQNIKNQQGMTLITSLLLLIIMTIVGVSATKVSSMSVIIAGNDQRKMELAQTLDSKLPQFASIETLAQTFTSTGFTPSDGETNKYIFNPVTEEGYQVNKVVSNLRFQYTCKRNGEASDVGADAPACDLYDFKIKMKHMGLSARDMRHQGSGKMVPRTEHAADATRGDYHFVN